MIAFICPCGCGRLIYFEINKNGSWTFDKETITITPSILRKNPNPNNPCTAHFWITNGEVVWC